MLFLIVDEYSSLLLVIAIHCRLLLTFAEYYWFVMLSSLSLIIEKSYVLVVTIENYSYLLLTINAYG